MKIAIAALKDSADSEISPQAGRAPYYLIFEDGEMTEAWKNTFASGGGGAGFGVAKVMSDKGVEKIYAAKMGEKMQAALDEKGVAYEETEGRASDVIS